MSGFAVPSGVSAMARRGPDWDDWVQSLPSTVEDAVDTWQLRVDGAASCGHCSLVLPVRTAGGAAAMLKIGFPDDESEHEHLALRRWAGQGAVRLLSADPHRRALLLERLQSTDLSVLPEVQACEVVAGLYRQLHVPAPASLRTLSSYIDRWTAQLANLPRSAPIPRRLVEQAVALGGELAADRSVPQVVLHTDLHYANVLAAERQSWLAIDPKPKSGDPHYEVAPMLWNRWDEITRTGGQERSDSGRNRGDVRGGVLRRLWSIVDAAGFDEDRTRAWVIVRMVHNAMWESQEPRPDPDWITRCIAVAKAVQD